MRKEARNRLYGFIWSRDSSLRLHRLRRSRSWTPCCGICVVAAEQLSASGCPYCASSSRSCSVRDAPPMSMPQSADTQKDRPSGRSFVAATNSGSRHAVKRAQLVAVGIAQIGQVDRTGAALADARRVLDRLAAMGNTRLVPGIPLFLTCHREADRAAIGVRGRFSVDGFAHHEHPAVVHVDQPALVVLLPGFAVDRAKQGIVERLRPGDIVAADHHMAEHSFSSLPKSQKIIVSAR